MKRSSFIIIYFRGFKRCIFQRRTSTFRPITARPARLWLESSLDQRLRLQKVFFPAVLAFNGEAFGRSSTSLFFNPLRRFLRVECKFGVTSTTKSRKRNRSSPSDTAFRIRPIATATKISRTDSGIEVRIARRCSSTAACLVLRDRLCQPGLPVNRRIWLTASSASGRCPV